MITNHPLPLKNSRLRLWILPPLLVCLTSAAPAQMEDASEPRGSLAGQRAIEELKRAQRDEDYNLRYGHIGFRTEATLGAGYTDNVFLSPGNRRDDFIVHPEVKLTAFVPLTELNTIRLGLGMGYEWFANNHALNSDAPLINPDSELVFNLFVKDFRIRFHDRFSYQQTLVFNDQPVNQTRIYNFTNVTQFERLDNFVGATVDWDLNKVLLTAGFDHENFNAMTDQFRYLNRNAEWFQAAASYLLGDRRKIGIESAATLNNFDREVILNDNWRARFGPFVDWKLPEAMTLHAGGGYDLARFDAAARNSDYDTWYGYARLEQELRWFTHSLSVGRETLMGDNANNLRIHYVRYAILTQTLRNFDLEGSFTVEFSKESGGAYYEKFVHYVPAIRVGYRFHKYWRADAGYEFFYNDSDTRDRSFHRNRLNLGVTFQF